MKNTNQSPLHSADFFVKACIFEASLTVVAVVLGWIAGIDPFLNFHFTESAIAVGILATVPLLLLYIFLARSASDSIRQIRRLLLETLGPVLIHYHWTDFFVLAAVAGISEEILFRGVIQPWMEISWGLNAGLIGSNILFGLVHAITPMYALLASLMGIYLGLILDYGGHRNLLIPIIIHGLYDFLAFVILMRDYRASRSFDADD